MRSAGYLDGVRKMLSVPGCMLALRPSGQSIGETLFSRRITNEPYLIVMGVLACHFYGLQNY